VTPNFWTVVYTFMLFHPLVGVNIIIFRRIIWVKWLFVLFLQLISESLFLYFDSQPAFSVFLCTCVSARCFCLLGCVCVCVCVADSGAGAAAWRRSVSVSSADHVVWTSAELVEARSQEEGTCVYYLKLAHGLRGRVRLRSAVRAVTLNHNFAFSSCLLQSLNTVSEKEVFGFRCNVTKKNKTKEHHSTSLFSYFC